MKSIIVLSTHSNIKIRPEHILFFDMDGTLVNTNVANFLSYKKAVHSITKSEYDMTYNSYPRFNRITLKIAVPNLTETEYERIVQRKEEYYNDFLHETELIKETADILFKYSKTNKTVLVTNSRKDRAMTILKRFGLEEHFGNIFCKEFIENGKKNKFQNAISKLDIFPNLVVAFENEETEIANARQAGIEIINPVLD